tara:strand:- start:6489 stop:6776 length:288 start_codon:yes stop_codon:yes gene_type:complete
MDFEMKFGWDGIKVRTANNGGHTIDQVSEMCADRIMTVSETAPDVIKAQAEAFKAEILNVVRQYIKMAVKEDRATMCAKIQEAGFPDLAEQLRRL